MTRLVEAVPNFSEGRDSAFPAAAADCFARSGCDVLHATSDPDHNRSVVTAVGPPGAVERGAVDAARLARDRIDMRVHRGLHPRVGALDVLPFVPLRGVGMSDAVRLARRVGERIGRLGIPVFHYAEASNPPGRGLAEIRRGGFEALRRRRGSLERGADVAGLDEEGGHTHASAHPTAGATCVGAREVLLAWNVDVDGIDLGAARRVAAALRESRGGHRGLRALALHLPIQERTQISMTLARPDLVDPTRVFAALEAGVRGEGGSVAGTELIGMAPDSITDEAAAAMGIRDWSPDRVLSRRVAAVVENRRQRGASRSSPGRRRRHPPSKAPSC